MRTIVGIHQVDEVACNHCTSILLNRFSFMVGYELIEHGEHFTKHPREMEASCPLAICVWLFLNQRQE